MTHLADHKEPLLSALHAVQDAHGHLPADELTRLAAERRLPAAALAGFVSFFDGFHRQPLSPDSVRVCTGPACRLAGGMDALDDANAVAAPCLGRCDQAPVCLPMDAGSGAACAAYPKDHWAWLERFAAVAALNKLLDQLEASGLAGMGGAGFPMHKKIAAVRAAPTPNKFVIANADEGEPGTFKDRDLLCRHPDEVLAGLLLACRLTGAANAYVYIRHDYPEAHRHLTETVRQMAAAGLIGNTDPSPTAPRVTLIRGGGAYICGEETALIASLEGRRGEPQPGPPHPSEHGLYGAPTLVQNVETLLYLTRIAENGANWYRLEGAGRRHFSVSGAVNQPGVYEHPTHVSARTILEAAGGSVPGAQLKAFIPGGGSTGFLPLSALDVPLTTDGLPPLGTGPGTGGVVFIPESACLVDLARGLMDFFAAESCGQCDPCRLGTVELTHRLGALSRGEAAPAESLAATCHAMETLSICGLGRWAPVVVRSLERHFADEVAAHRSGTCPAGICGVRP